MSPDARRTPFRLRIRQGSARDDRPPKGPLLARAIWLALPATRAVAETKQQKKGK